MALAFGLIGTALGLAGLVLGALALSWARRITTPVAAAPAPAAAATSTGSPSA